LSTGPGGGLYTGPSAQPYKNNWPPLKIFIAELRKRGYESYADTLAKYHGES
jgi:hypothetical protein